MRSCRSYSRPVPCRTRSVAYIVQAHQGWNAHMVQRHAHRKSKAASYSKQVRRCVGFGGGARRALASGMVSQNVGSVLAFNASARRRRVDALGTRACARLSEIRAHADCERPHRCARPRHIMRPVGRGRADRTRSHRVAGFITRARSLRSKQPPVHISALNRCA